MLSDSLHTFADTDLTSSASFDSLENWGKQANAPLPFDRRYHFDISDGISAEIVQARSYEPSAFRFRAPVHLLVVHEQGARHQGETFVEGAARSTLRYFGRTLTFVPAHHEYHEWQEPRTLTRLMYVYFDPAKLYLFDPKIMGAPLAAKLFFEDANLLNTALKLKWTLETATVDHALYLQALGLLLAHEVIRFNGGRQQPTH